MAMIVIIIVFWGYIWLTGTYQQLIEGSGVYRIRVADRSARIVLPSLREPKENYRKMKELCETAIRSFEITNPRVVRAIEWPRIVIPPSGYRNEEYEGLHDLRENKIYIYAAGNREIADSEKILRHEILHEFFFKHASVEEEKRINKSINNLYNLFPKNFGQYVKSEYFKTDGDVVKFIENMKKQFKLTSEDVMNLIEVIIIWVPVYGLAEENFSVGAKELNFSAISEIFSYFAEDKVPEPLLETYRGILSEDYLKEYTPLPKETIERAQDVFKNKIEPYI